MSLNKNIIAIYVGMVLAVNLLSCQKAEPLFELLPPERTGISFSNDITQNDTLNIINTTNLFNGGGVGIGDFNNDGLQDIYFTGLMTGNELYLNEGDFRFRNVTEQAGVGADNRWSGGVAVVDINGDGLLDIYVCATTNEKSEQRTNLFYINQGMNDEDVPVFSEMAMDFNVAFTGHSTMAAFFDYDNDQDLDLYLMVNQFNRQNSMTRYSGSFQSNRGETRDRLYRNEGSDADGHPQFKDVSNEAGITKEGFGLGLNIVDINHDGWKDIYVANDFYTNDLLYINNGDGTFTDKNLDVFKHTAYAAMGSDIADLNNDGYAEVVVADMRPEGNYRKKRMLQPNDYSAYLREKRNNSDDQFVRNVLQVYQGIHPETGEPLYVDTGIYSGIAETDWSWAPLLVDLDNDSWRDIIVTNGFPRDMTDNDFEEYFSLYPQFISIEDALERLPSVKVSNYVYRNKQQLKFEDITEQWGMKIPSFSNGAAQADLNNDGTLDLVVNNINEPAFVFRNRLNELYPEKNNYLRIKLEGNEENTMGLGTWVEIEYGQDQRQVHEHTTYRGYMSSVEPVIHFGLGEARKIHKLKVVWPDSSIQEMSNIESNQVLTLRQDRAERSGKGRPGTSDRASGIFSDITGDVGISYMHQERDFNDYAVQPLLPHKLSQYGPGVSVGDANSDGLNDLYVSGSLGEKGLFLIQRRDGTFKKEDLMIGHSLDYRQEELGSLFFDADSDGDDDLYVVSGSYENVVGDPAYQDRLFINENGQYILDREALPSFNVSGSVVRAADYDRDGDLDLFIGGRVKPHRYPEPVNSYLLENVSDNGRAKFKIANQSKAPALDKLGMVTDGIWTDYNNDGWMDLVIVGEWMSLRFLRNDEGQLTDETNTTGIQNYKGWWNSICGGDFDRDGDTDYVAGNLGSNTYFHSTREHPVKIYGNDFDQNGTFDALPTIYDQNREGEKVEVPFHVRRNVMQQIPSVGKRFETSQQFASLTIEDLLETFHTEGMLTYEANHMQSSYIENKGDGKFEIHPLPFQAQWAPLYGCTVNDINGDGNPDVLFAGNDHGMELSVNRADALNGLTLTGNGDGSFEVMDFQRSGFFLPGDGKALVSYINPRGEIGIVGSQNKGPLKFFEREDANKPIPVEDHDAYALVHLDEKTIQKVEFYYGSGFISQSERYLVPPDEYSKIEIIDFSGSKRTIFKD